MISDLSLQYGIASPALLNMATSESSLNPDAVGDHGCSLGIVQINLCAHPNITRAEALDPHWALTYAAQAIADDTDYHWTSCNCYSYVLVHLGSLPLMAKIQPNSTPKVGGVAIFYYRSHEGTIVKHVALITAQTDTTISIAESNLERCKTDVRVVDKSDAHLDGYWYP